MESYTIDYSYIEVEGNYHSINIYAKPELDSPLLTCLPYCYTEDGGYCHFVTVSISECFLGNFNYNSSVNPYNIDALVTNYIMKGLNL